MEEVEEQEVKTKQQVELVELVVAVMVVADHLVLSLHIYQYTVQMGFQIQEEVVVVVVIIHHQVETEVPVSSSYAIGNHPQR
jgi:hypothetical protein